MNAKPAGANSFYDRVYKVVRLIPPGQVATYGQIGKLALCSPRQVGMALAALSESDIENVPWHRVVNSQGRISVRGGGEARQARELAQENVALSASGRIDLRQVQWPGPFAPPEF